MSGPTSDAQHSVVVENVSKSFQLPHERVHTLKERVLHPLRRRTVDELQALVDVSFDVRQGEFFGIVGRNGSGKSTLMKLLAGIYRIDSGRAWLRGHAATFIELGVGFNPDLTARENVVINAVMMGLTPEEAHRRFDSVMEFAELEEFVDLKLKNYSSGMYVRLGFAVMVQVEADVLLIDEVLAVGDAAFQRKCYETLDGLQREGRTILFVTHDMPTIERRCDRALMLDRGRLVELGEPIEVARRYNAMNFGAGTPGGDGDRRGDRAAALIDAWFEDASGRRVPMLDHGPAAFKLLVEFNEDVEAPTFGVSFVDSGERTLFSTTSEGSADGFSAGERVEVELRFDNTLVPGGYAITAWIAHDPDGDGLIDLRPRIARVTVLGERRGSGLIELPHDFILRREARAASERAAP